MTVPEAMHILRVYPCVGGVFTEPVGHKPTQEEQEAIDYLWAEWDYGYEPRS